MANELNDAIAMLNERLHAELRSPLRLLSDLNPYLAKSLAGLHRRLPQLAADDNRRAGELADAIESLGGTPTSPHVSANERSLAYLSIQFILPRLIEDERNAVERLREMLTRIGTIEEVNAIIRRHIAEHSAVIELFEQLAAAKVR